MSGPTGSVAPCGPPLPSRMLIAREGRPFILLFGVLALVTVGLAAIVGGWAAWVVAALSLLLTGFMLFFFRDPPRGGPRAPDLVLAAGDGRVIRVDTVEEPTYLVGPARRVAVFLSLFDVHVNRYPVGGVVEHRCERPGGYDPAFREAAGEGNAQLSVGIRTPAGCPVLVRQIAGLIARRIVNYATEGEAVEQGARMGLIRFGSRVEVFLPLSAEVLVAPGARSTGGVTVLARLHGEKVG
ncbi:MAG: phosphatidylserine decarboxylase [Gemmatimonadota bacterium]